jgi:DNA-binding XRE family transcriptional regulator
MVHADFPQGHGAREDTTRSTVTAGLSAVLAAARRRRGWSVREAARNIGVAAGTVVHLEKGRRAPSTVVAESIIRAYQLDSGEAAMLLAEAVEGAGWDSPHKRPSMGTGSGGALYGARPGRRAPRLRLGPWNSLL